MKLFAGLLAFLSLSFSVVAVAQCEDACDVENAFILASNPYTDSGQIEHWIWLRDKYYNERQDAALDRAGIAYDLNQLAAWLMANFGTTDLQMAYSLCQQTFGPIYCDAVYEFPQIFANFELWLEYYYYYQCEYDYWHALYWNAGTVVLNWP